VTAIRIWDVSTGQLLRTLLGHAQVVMVSRLESGRCSHYSFRSNCTALGRGYGASVENLAGTYGLGSFSNFGVGW